MSLSLSHKLPFSLTIYNSSVWIASWYDLIDCFWCVCVCVCMLFALFSHRDKNYLPFFSSFCVCFFLIQRPLLNAFNNLKLFNDRTYIHLEYMQVYMCCSSKIFEYHQTVAFIWLNCTQYTHRNDVLWMHRLATCTQRIVSW